MTSLDELFAEYLAAEQRGERPDLAGLLDRAGAEREQLADLIDAHLALAEPRPDEADIERLAADPRLAPPPLAWPDVLVAARRRLRLTRGAAVERLAGLLGIGGPPGRARVEERYHELETGQLDPRGVSDRLVDALGRLYPDAVEALARTRSQAAGAFAPPRAAYHRAAGPPPAAAAAAPDPETTSARERRDPEVERVDELFGAGDGA
jgi:hypothetical protein